MLQVASRSGTQQTLNNTVPTSTLQERLQYLSGPAQVMPNMVMSVADQPLKDFRA